jgi:histidinol-phosphatase (PHP family)
VDLYDQHLHTWHSEDCQADPADSVRRAIDLGLAGVTFTDHFDTHPREWPKCQYDYEAIARAVAELREQFGRQIFIGHGIEVCYQPQQMPWVLDYLDAHRFDVVLLSSHYMGERALHVREQWDGLDTASATRAYLDTVWEAVQFAGKLNAQGRPSFDVLGHLDLVKRYTQRYFQTFDVRSHADRVDDILRACLDWGIIPELNLSTLRQDLFEPMPADWIVRRYAELGGEAMSLGSDAHVADDVGAGLAEAAAILKREGIRRQAVFKDRRRCDVSL